MTASKISQLLAIEKRRYAKKGALNTIIGLSSLLLIMGIAFTIGRCYWPQEVQDKMSFVTVGSIIINFSMEIVGFLIYLPGYLGWSKYYAANLNNKKALRPWERSNWGEVRSKTIKNFVINQLVLYPAIVYLVNLQGIKVRFEGFPSFQEFSLQMLFIYYFEDCLFYFAHRLFHSSRFLYRWHKVHHEYDTLYTWVAEYLHPGDFVFGNLLPGAVPLVVLGERLHCFSFFYWVFWKILLSCENHSGYEFEWSPLRVFPLIANTAHHDNHHSHNVGNYGGSCYFWDLLLGTYVPYSPDL